MRGTTPRYQVGLPAVAQQLPQFTATRRGVVHANGSVPAGLVRSGGPRADTIVTKDAYLSGGSMGPGEVWEIHGTGTGHAAFWVEYDPGTLDLNTVCWYTSIAVSAIHSVYDSQCRYVLSGRTLTLTLVLLGLFLSIGPSPLCTGTLKLLGLAVLPECESLLL